MPTATESKSAEAGSPGFPPTGFQAAASVQAVVVGVLLVVAFWPILTGIYGSWFDEHAYMEHGILVVPAAVFMVWVKRARLAQVPRRPSNWGIAFLCWGAAQAIFGVVAQWIWVSRISFLISLVGCILVLYGTRMVRELVYPLATLVLMITPPTFVFERLTLDLQLLASRLGEGCLEALGYSVMREGNILEMVGLKLSVEEACSGIRSLVSILFLCVQYNYFFVEGTSLRAFILLMAVPIAILGNVARIVITGILGQHNAALIHGKPHEAVGYFTIIVAGVSCIALHALMTRIQKVWRSRRA